MSVLDKLQNVKTWSHRSDFIIANLVTSLGTIATLRTCRRAAIIFSVFSYFFDFLLQWLITGFFGGLTVTIDKRKMNWKKREKMVDKKKVACIRKERNVKIRIGNPHAKGIGVFHLELKFLYRFLIKLIFKGFINTKK